MNHIHTFPRAKWAECLECGGRVSIEKGRYVSSVHAFARVHEECAKAPHRQGVLTDVAAHRLCVSRGRVIQLIKKGFLGATKAYESHSYNGQRTKRWVYRITEEAIAAYRELRGTFNARGHLPDCRCARCDHTHPSAKREGNKNHKAGCECSFCVRKDVVDVHLSLGLPEYLHTALTKEAESTGFSRAEILRQALSEYFEARGSELAEEESWMWEKANENRPRRMRKVKKRDRLPRTGDVQRPVVPQEAGVG